MPDDSLPFIPTDQKEKMALYVRGRLYDRWTSARVTLQVDVPFQEFQFSVSEPLDTHFDWDTWHIVVGDPVKVYVGGQMVIDGFIDIREAFYDANSHGVMFYGRSYNANAYESSVRMDGSGECQLINATFTQIMQRALQGTGTSISAPDDDGTIYPNFSISFGETPWNVAERLKRYIPALRVTCKSIERTWEARAAYLAGGGATFIEGENIKSARATIDARGWMAFAHSLGQQPNRDERSVSEANEVEGKAEDGSLPETAKPRYYALPLPDPANQKMAQGAASHELIKRGEDIVHCTVTVWSWFERGGGLFWIYKPYTVHSPMLGMDNNPLWARMVSFEQSDAGSTSTLELSSKSALFGLGHETPAQLGSLGPGTNYAGQGVQVSSITGSQSA